MHRITTWCLAALGALACLATDAAAQDWNNWRGPEHNGSSTARNLPATFSKTQNVKWVAPMPGPSAATPIVVGDRIFVASVDTKAQNLAALCLDRKTGNVLWSKLVSSGYRAGNAGNAIQLDDSSNYASPSPVSDGKLAVFLYGNGDMIAFDLQGKELWRRNLQQEHGDFAYQWTYSASPLLYDGKLYVQVLQRNQPAHSRGKQGSESFLLCYNPATGEELWKHVRPSPAQMESLESFATPTPYVHEGQKQILIAGGDVLTGHDPASGREFWRWGTWNANHREQWWRLVPSPVSGGGVHVVCAPKKAPVYAIKAGLQGDMTYKPEGLAWSSSDKSVTSDVVTPLYYKGHFWIVFGEGRDKMISCVTPAGEVKGQVKLPGPQLYRASPLGADDKIYLMNHAGVVVVLEATPEMKTLATVAMGDEGEDKTRSSIVAAQDQIFIRTAGKLYCIGQ